MHPSAEYFMAESPLAGRHILHQQLRSGLKQSLYQQQQQQQQQHSFQSTAGNNENSQMNHNPTAAPTTSIVGFDVNTALAADQNENTGRNDLPSKFFTMETGSKFRNPDQTADLLEANNFEAIQSPFSPSSAVDQFGGAEQLSFSSNRNAAASPTLSPVVKLSPDRKRLLEYEAELQRNEQSIHRLQTDIETVQTEFNACKRQLQQQISANAALQQSHSEIEVDRNNWEEACKRHRESLNQLKTEHEQLLAEREQLMERVQECEEALQLKESDIADLNGAVEQLKSENQELMINLEQYQEENALLTEQLDEFEKLKSQQYLKESEIDQLTQQLREVQESAFVSSTMSLQDELLISQRQQESNRETEKEQGIPQQDEILNEDELKCDADFEPSKLFDGILKSPATAAGGEYTAHLEAEVENLRNRLSDAWRQWEKEHKEKELFKTTSQTEINNLKAQLARFGHLLQKDDPELPSFVDLNENNFSNNNNTISNNIYQQQELINGLVDELMDAENNIMPPGDMEALKSAYEQMWTSFVKVARQFAQINQQDDALFSNSSMNMVGSKSVLAVAGGAEWLLRFKRDIEQVLRETLTEMEDLRLQRNKLRHQLKQLQESADADNSCKSPLASAPDQLPESAQQIAEIIKQRNHEIAQYKAQLEILRDELDSVRSGSAGRRVLTESTSAQTTIEMDSDATQTESVDKAVKSIQTEEELAEQEANSQEASRILQSLAAITNSPLSFKDSPSLRNRKRASGRKSTSPLKAMATVHEVKKLQSILKDSQQTSPLRRLVSSVSVTLYTLMIWVVGVMMGVMLVSVLLRSGSLSTQSNDLLWSGNDFSLTADEWNAASPNNPPPLYQFFEKHEGIDDEYGQIPAAANAKSAPAKSFWQRLTSWLPSKQ